MWKPVLPCLALLLAASPVLAAPDPAPTPTAPPRSNGPSISARPAPELPRGLMRYDTNKDGVVDRTEWKAGQEARFRSLDSNGDGRLTAEELFARPSRATVELVPSDRDAQRQATYFRLLDADRDGVVTLAEFMAQAERNFARCDLNQDGRIDTAECRQALQPAARAQR